MTKSLHLEQFARLAFYNSWFNSQLYGVAAEMTNADRTRDMGAYFKSVHGTLNHLLLTDRIWLGRFRKLGFGRGALEDADLVESFDSLRDELYTDFVDLAGARRATDDTLNAWVRRLTDEDLAARLKYENSKGIEREHSLWFAMSHLFNHQAHHRGQLTTLYTQLGYDSGVTDFLAIAHLDEAVLSFDEQNG